jgi:hypothetical protein
MGKNLMSSMSLPNQPIKKTLTCFRLPDCEFTQQRLSIALTRVFSSSSVTKSGHSIMVPIAMGGREEWSKWIGWKSFKISLSEDGGG